MSIMRLSFCYIYIILDITASNIKYLMSKAQAFKTLGQVTSMDMSPNNRLIAVGGKQSIKIVSINPQNDYWFEIKKAINRYKGSDKAVEKRMVSVNSLAWSKNQKLAIVASFNSIYIYDMNDFNVNKYEMNLTSLFQYQAPKKIVWVPDSPHIFAAASNSDLINFDTRADKVTSCLPIDDLSDFKYNPTNSNSIALTSKSDKIYVFDTRNYTIPVIVHDNLIPTQHKIPIDWSPDGTMLANSSGSKLKIWKIDGEKLIGMEKIHHSQLIRGLKWLKKQKNSFLISQNKPPKLLKYDRKQPNRFIGEYLAYSDPQFTLNQWILDQEQDLIITACSFQNQKESVIVSQFADNILNIWDGKFNYPVQFDHENNLLFSAKKWNKKRIQQTYPILLHERDQTSISIEDYNYFDQFNRKSLLRQQIKSERKKQQKLKLAQKKQFNKKIQQKLLKRQVSFQSLDKVQLKTKSIDKDKGQFQSQREDEMRLVKTKSSVHENTKNKILHKNAKKSMRSIQSHYSICSQDNLTESDQEELIINPSNYLLYKRQQIEYLIKNYRVDLDTKNWKEIVQHNCHIARTIGKNICYQFWNSLLSVAFAEDHTDISIEQLYENNKQMDISFQNNKITLHYQSPPPKSLPNDHIKVQKIIQNLVDQNELQTAAIAACLLVKLNKNLLDQLFFNKILAQYKQILKKMNLHVRSIEISHLIKMGEFDTGYNITYQFSIKCSLCGKRKNICQCAIVCILCAKSINKGIITICKICGHAGHALEYRKWFVEDTNTECPYGCGHECFTSKIVDPNQQ